jgi:hypothetical protein
MLIKLKLDCVQLVIPDSQLSRGLERIALSPQELREQADRCIGWARTAGSASERKLYLQLAVTWLENAVRLEPGAIELCDADAATLPAISPARNP